MKIEVSPEELLVLCRLTENPLDAADVVLNRYTKPYATSLRKNTEVVLKNLYHRLFAIWKRAE